MKANELQIGDWVKVEDNFTTKITAIYDEMIQTQANYQSEIDGEWYSEAYIKDLKPIPLTAEILEKIGFLEFMPHNWQIVIDDTMIELREPEHNMAIWLDWEHYRDVYASYIFPGPNCVHELQHALRLCGIEKEIEL